ncbi:MAG TPA: secretin N-terminal domain-containing protein, partial [Kiritimatiellia bacterium]|nr:secretin N-terminal domain-containing protein [Kiritimatiellia bacterium]
PGAGSTVEVIELRHASAEEVAKQLRATFGATDTAVNKVHRHFQQVAGGTGSLPTDFTVVEAPEANSLILVGMPSQIAETRRIIEKMDVESPHGFGRLNAIFLKYLSAEEAAKSLNALLGKGTEAEPARRGIAIEPSIPNNALLVDASAQDFEYVRRLVERLDVVPQQVLVEVLIAEVNLEEGLDLGVEWFGIDTPEGSETGGFGRTRYGDSDSMMSLLTEGAFPQGLALGVISGTFTGPDGTEYSQIPLYLKAVAGNRDLKILSNIPLWAQNNLEASVSVVENIPILKSSVEGSGSDRDFIQNIERLDVGIKLKLTPQVNPDREIRLELNPSIESVVEESSEALRYTPTIAKREVQTTVTIPDRATVILSGLIREDTSKLTTKVPLLGDLPLLGWLFRSTSDVKKRTNLLIFVTPRIVTDMQMAEKEKARLERAASLQGAREALDEPSPAAEAQRQREADEKARRDAKKKSKADRRK